MKRTVFAFAIAALTFAAVPVSQAAPIAPLPAGVSADQSNVTQVYWRGYGWRGYGWRGYGWRGYGWRGYGWRGYGYGWHRCWWRYGYRHCW
jgi:hypothetical protein